MIVTVEHVSKQFGSFTALKDVALETHAGEFLALLGPSGSGKTTLLRIMAGLEFADSGTVRFNGEDMTGRAAPERAVGFVFQHYALFRHMTVAKNIAFGLEVKPARERPSPEAIRARVAELLDLVQLGGLAQRYPAQLSGGQRQRVALARALAVGPRLLLLDEPFGALDAKVRKELRIWLRHVHEEMGLTSIFVTHDQEEALELADRVVVMSNGQIEQVGSPREVYESPATAFVCGFLGQANRLDCRLASGAVELEGLRLPNLVPGQPDGPATAYIRPHEFRITAADGGGEGWPATVRRITRTGALTAIEADALGRTLDLAALCPEPFIAPGAAVRISPTAVRAFA